MTWGFQRKQVALAVGIAQHASVLPAVQRLLAAGHEVLLVGEGSVQQAAEWAHRGLRVGVGSEASLSPAIAVAGAAQAPDWMLQSPHRLSLESAALAGGQMIGNLEEWVDTYLAPRVPRFV